MGQRPVFAVAPSEKAVREQGRWRVWLRNARDRRWSYIDAQSKTVLTHDGVTGYPCGIEGSISEFRLELDGTVVRGGRKLGSWTWHRADGLSRSAAVLVTSLILNLEASGGKNIMPPCELLRARATTLKGTQFFVVGYAPMLIVAALSKDWRPLIPVVGPFSIVPRYGSGVGQGITVGIATASTALQAVGLFIVPLGLLQEHYAKRGRSAGEASVWPDVHFMGSTVRLNWSY